MGPYQFVVLLFVAHDFQGCQAQLNQGKRAWKMACVSFYEAGLEVHISLILVFPGKNSVLWPHLTAKEDGKPISTLFPGIRQNRSDEQLAHLSHSVLKSTWFTLRTIVKFME